MVSDRMDYGEERPVVPEYVASIRLAYPAVPEGCEMALSFNGPVNWMVIKQQVKELQGIADRQLVHEFLRRTDEILKKEMPDD